MQTVAAEILPSHSDGAAYIDPYANGIRFDATFVSTVEVNSQRDNQEVREKVTKAIVAANNPSSKVVITVRLNTVCITNITDNSHVNYLITQIVYCGAHVHFKDKFFFIHSSKHNKSLFAQVYQLSDSDTVKLLTLTIARAFKISYEGWFSYVEKEVPKESPHYSHTAPARLNRANSVPAGIIDRFSTSPWPPAPKNRKNRPISLGGKPEILSGCPAVYKVQTVNSRTVHSVSLTIDMDREFRELAQSRSSPSYLPIDLPTTEVDQFNLCSVKKHWTPE